MTGDRELKHFLRFLVIYPSVHGIHVFCFTQDRMILRICFKKMQMEKVGQSRDEIRLSKSSSYMKLGDKLMNIYYNFLSTFVYF